MSRWYEKVKTSSRKVVDNKGGRYCAHRCREDRRRSLRFCLVFWDSHFFKEAVCFEKSGNHLTKLKAFEVLSVKPVKLDFCNAGLHEWRPSRERIF